MGTPVDQMPIEIAVGDLETRYVEMGEMGLRQFGEHARRVLQPEVPVT
jgi:hypothetical protein